MEKEKIKKNIAKYYPLYKIHGSRLQRLVHNPIHTGFFYIQNFFAHLRPFSVSKQMPWGAKMSFYLPEANQIYYYDFWEINLANFVINFLKPGDTFVDVKAHVGYYTSLAAALVGPNGTVLAIEPTPRTFESLKKNLSSFPYGYAQNVALCDKEGAISFYDYGSALSAFNSFTKREELGNKKLHPDKIEINTTTLDNILKENAPHPTLVKIDAEGAESAILRGSFNKLTKLRPVITIEVGGYEAWQESTKEAVKLLNDSSYQIYTIETSGSLKVKDSDIVSGYDNLVALPIEKTEHYQHLINIGAIIKSLS